MFVDPRTVSRAEGCLLGQLAGDCQACSSIHPSQVDSTPSVVCSGLIDVGSMEPLSYANPRPMDPQEGPRPPAGHGKSLRFRGL